MARIELRGGSVVVRDWRAEDLTALAHWLQPGRKWRELDGPYYPQPSAAEIPKQLAPFRRAVEASELPEPRVSMAIAKAADDSLVGRVTRYWQSEETLWLSLGIDVYDPGEWGRGIGRAALGLWSQYLLGFSLEARFRDARRVRGERYDGIGYGILRAEWHERYPDGFAAHLDAPPDPE